MSKEKTGVEWGYDGETGKNFYQTNLTKGLFLMHFLSSRTIFMGSKI
jgi:hypothetical protein